MTRKPAPHPLSLIAAALALSLGLGAAAQVPLTPAQGVASDPDAVLVEELVVTGRLPGPAWWRVSDADTTVYVLGVPSLAPRQMQWDRGVFDRRLQGANTVILPFRPLRVKLIGAPLALVSYARLKSRTPFEDTLDASTRARFVAVRGRLGQPADRYGTRNALAAGLRLIGDYREQARLTDTDPTKLIRLLAQQAKVPVEQKTYDLGPLLSAVARTPAAAGRVCFDQALAEAESGPAGVREAARAWAVGDVRGALDAERSYEQCLAGAPGAAAFDARTKADQAVAIARALRTPGHAIAVVQLRPLLSQGGVLDRLRSQGFEIRTPGEL